MEPTGYTITDSNGIRLLVDPTGAVIASLRRDISDDEALLLAWRLNLASALLEYLTDTEVQTFDGILDIISHHGGRGIGTVAR